ncbi:MAG: riboflavin kinase, partial [Planctomycetota bacterium]|nr:riboflavin kinase [Planctomycetota bacterium]
ANLTESETLIPADGVYAGKVVFENGSRFAAAVHIGANPTFNQAERKVEVHLLGFSGDIYGHSLSVDLLDRVRGTQKFADVEELKSQLHRDLAHVREIVTLN